MNTTQLKYDISLARITIQKSKCKKIVTIYYLSGIQIRTVKQL